LGELAGFHICGYILSRNLQSSTQPAFRRLLTKKLMELEYQGGALARRWPKLVPVRPPREIAELARVRGVHLGLTEQPTVSTFVCNYSRSV
jgi:predicted nucleic acid-binding Zn ribbon protein